tara:strand:- start:994 stop:1239 length:246 start_codon:yes stop_codon:yes gene_type:complete
MIKEKKDGINNNMLDLAIPEDLGTLLLKFDNSKRFCGHDPYRFKSAVSVKNHFKRTPPYINIIIPNIPIEISKTLSEELIL